LLSTTTSSDEGGGKERDGMTEKDITEKSLRLIYLRCEQGELLRYNRRINSELT